MSFLVQNDEKEYAKTDSCYCYAVQKLVELAKSLTKSVNSSDTSIAEDHQDR